MVSWRTGSHWLALHCSNFCRPCKNTISRSITCAFDKHAGSCRVAQGITSTAVRLRGRGGRDILVGRGLTQVVGKLGRVCSGDYGSIARMIQGSMAGWPAVRRQSSMQNLRDLGILSSKWHVDSCRALVKWEQGLAFVKILESPCSIHAEAMQRFS